MFGGAHVVIVEDEPLIALDLAATVEAAEGQVVGPFASVAEALAAVERMEIAAAILDANFVDGKRRRSRSCCESAVFPSSSSPAKDFPPSFGSGIRTCPSNFKPAEPHRILEALSAMVVSLHNKGHRPDDDQEGPGV